MATVRVPDLAPRRWKPRRGSQLRVRLAPDDPQTTPSPSLAGRVVTSPASNKPRRTGRTGRRRRVSRCIVFRRWARICLRSPVLVKWWVVKISTAGDLLLTAANHRVRPACGLLADRVGGSPHHSVAVVFRERSCSTGHRRMPEQGRSWRRSNVVADRTQLLSVIARAKTVGSILPPEPTSATCRSRTSTEPARTAPSDAAPPGSSTSFR